MESRNFDKVSNVCNFSMFINIIKVRKISLVCELIFASKFTESQSLLNKVKYILSAKLHKISKVSTGGTVFNVTNSIKFISVSKASQVNKFPRFVKV